MAAPTPSGPETYTLAPTPHVPNSPYPVLVYRAAIPAAARSVAAVKALIEPHAWLHGGTWKAIRTIHFHSVTHECYAVLRGASVLLLGRGPLDPERSGGSGDEDTPFGVEVEVRAGDVVVVPAGVSHASLSDDGAYEYAGLYPKGSPRWDNNWCKAGPEETAEKAKTARAVPVPECDPVFGEGGPLVKIWREAVAACRELQTQ